MGSTLLAVFFICIGSINDFEGIKLPMPKIEPSAILSSLGTVLFTFGGHSALPTVQHDMRNPSEFSKSSITAFISKIFFIKIIFFFVLLVWEKIDFYIDKNHFLAQNFCSSAINLYKVFFF